MRLYEHEAKRIFAERGLRVPRSYGVIENAAEVDGLDLEGPAMVKALVLTGGRGKRGGVRKALDLPEARRAAEEILALEIGGYPVERVLVEEAVAERGACYVGVTTNPADFRLIVMASAAGGVDIETTAKERPEAILRREVRTNDLTLPEELAAEFGEFLARGLGDGASREALGAAVAALYDTFQAIEAKVAEINPLLVTEGGDVVAADAKIVLDDNALYRQRRIFRLLGLTEARHDASELTRDERRAREAGFPYVDLLPEDAERDPEKLYVGLVPGGAGYGIFSIDETANVGELLNTRVPLKLTVAVI